jgi:hypothetical protein
LQAHEHEEPAHKVKRHRLKTKKTKKPRAYEKRGLKYRNEDWYMKRYRKLHAKHPQQEDEVKENEDA